jgi:plastocyanin
MNRRSRTLIVTTSAVLLFALFFVQRRNMSLRAETTPPVAEVKIDNFTFSPATLTVKRGTQITWTNHDDIPHTVASNDNLFKSKVLDTDEKFTFTPAKPGTYSYFCTIHPKMTGKVVVE